MERRPTESEKFVNRVNGKEPAAWEELYARYYKALCAYSASLTGDAAFAEDLVQELLLRMWQSDRTFSVLPELAAYLYRSVYRNSLAYRRDRSNRESLLRNMHEQSLRDGNFPPPRRSRGGVRATCRNGRRGGYPPALQRHPRAAFGAEPDHTPLDRRVQGRGDRPPAGHQHQYGQNPEVPRLSFAAAQTQQVRLPFRLPPRAVRRPEIDAPGSWAAGVTGSRSGCRSRVSPRP